MDDFEIDLNMEKLDCPSCGIIFFLPQNFVNRKRSLHDNFYCPNNHPMCFHDKKEDHPDVLKEKLASAEDQIDKLKTQVLYLTHQLEQLETKFS